MPVVDICVASRSFVHGHTYQGHPAACAAALEVQRIIREENLLGNVQKLGARLAAGLKNQLSHHPNVGDIRGRGFFWGVEFVADKQTLAPFPTGDHVALEICELGLSRRYSISVYPGSGTVDGAQGDHIIISPPYNVSSEDIDAIVATVTRLINDYFARKQNTI